MSEIANVNAKSFSATEIVFAGMGDLKTFFEEVTDSKHVMVTYIQGGKKVTELVGPDMKTKIDNGQVKIRAIEDSP